MFKDNLNKFVTKLVENEDHQLNTDEAAKRALIKKIDDNKAAVSSWFVLPQPLLRS